MEIAIMRRRLVSASFGHSGLQDTKKRATHLGRMPSKWRWETYSIPRGWAQPGKRPWSWRKLKAWTNHQWSGDARSRCDSLLPHRVLSAFRVCSAGDVPPPVGPLHWQEVQFYQHAPSWPIWSTESSCGRHSGDERKMLFCTFLFHELDDWVLGFLE